MLSHFGTSFNYLMINYYISNKTTASEGDKLINRMMLIKAKLITPFIKLYKKT